MAIVSQVPSSLRADFGPDFPIPEHLLRAVNLMLDLDYTAGAIDCALGHLARFGTAEGCATIDPEHRAMVEAELDHDPAWNSTVWDEYIYCTDDWPS